MFLLRQFFLNIPSTLEDAARLDGCGSFGVLRHVILPLSKPVLITLGLFTFIAAWNSFIWPLVVLSDQSYYPLTVGLSLFREESGADWPRIFAASVMGSLPLICLLVPLAFVLDAYVTLTMVAAVEDELGVFDAFGRAWQTVQENLGPVIIMALILILGGGIAGVVLMAPFFALGLPSLAGLAFGTEQAMISALS